MDHTIIGKKIASARQELGLTQAQLAEKINKKPYMISDIERSRVHVNADDLYEIASVLQKPIAYFFEQSNDPARKEKTIDFSGLSAAEADQLELMIDSYLKAWRSQDQEVPLDAEEMGEILVACATLKSTIPVFLNAIEKKSKETYELFFPEQAIDSQASPQTDDRAENQTTTMQAGAIKATRKQAEAALSKWEKRAMKELAKNLPQETSL